MWPRGLSLLRRIDRQAEASLQSLLPYKIGEGVRRDLRLIGK
jgi:hypothetical protein